MRKSNYYFELCWPGEYFVKDERHFRVNNLFNDLHEKYRFFGESVVKQCLVTKTHHLDVSGEPEFLETIQLNYDQEAREKKIFIVGSCGFDSVPADLGVVFTQNSCDCEQLLVLYRIFQLKIFNKA